jgi:hypothetical protein
MFELGTNCTVSESLYWLAGLGLCLAGDCQKLPVLAVFGPAKLPKA